MKTLFPNTNTAAAWVMAETLHRCGLRHAVLSPGSRSTPLTLALACHPGVEAIPVLDERSAGFFALGLARQTGRPVVLVCTSGTAAANYLPAVIEAAESGVPLLVLTADRPPEMRACSSGQTIDQIKLYGHYPTWQMELGVPEATEAGLRTIRQNFLHAWQRTSDPVAGPVHLNLPFRDPLEPTPVEGGVDCPFLADDSGFFLHLGQPIKVERKACLPADFTGERGLVIDGTGGGREPGIHAAAVLALASWLGWPVLADGVSPTRQRASAKDPVITAYEVLLRDSEFRAAHRPERVICIGPLPTSKLLRAWLRDCGVRILFVDPGERNLDPGHGRSIRVRCRVEDLTHGGEERKVDPVWIGTWVGRDRQAVRRLSRGLAGMPFPTGCAVVRTLGQKLRRGTRVFAASSMAIRYVEFVWPGGRGHRFACNRGANGIDGTLSTALGLAHGGDPAWLITGDLALLHDSNGLLMAPHFKGSLTILLIHNEGGGIFDHLPIAGFDPPFEAFFVTPQSVDFAILAAAHGVGYKRIQTEAELVKAIGERPGPGIRLLEVRTDRKADAGRLRDLIRG